MAKISSVDEYLSGFEGSALDLLTRLRSLCRDDANGTTEEVRWNQPAYVHASGTILYMFSGHTAHANIVFTPSTLEAFLPDLDGWGTGKGSIRLPYGDPLPAELLERMFRYRVEEHERRNVLWM